MPKPNFIVVISHVGALEDKILKALNIEVAENATIVVTDVRGQTHYIPKAMWASVAITPPVVEVEIPKGAT